MRNLSVERRRIAALGGASAALSSSSLVLFQHAPHTLLYGVVEVLVVSIPVATTIVLFVRLKRANSCDRQKNA